MLVLRGQVSAFEGSSQLSFKTPQYFRMISTVIKLWMMAMSGGRVQ
jgi:hypothetical protein